MIVRTLPWDSELFQKKIGEIRFDRRKLSRLPGIVQKAQKKGFQYLICRLRTHDTVAVKTLESSGFYLSDIGVIWNRDTRRNVREINKRPALSAKAIRKAGIEDIPLLQKMITAMFVTSRFYSDPFFNRSEANRLYRKWIENSVLGNAADMVFFIPGSGLVSCKKKKRGGETVLIGVVKQSRGKGIGTLLLKYAIQWFRKNEVNTIRARTQLKNIFAMNFYRQAGFAVAEYDLIFSRIL